MKIKNVLICGIGAVGLTYANKFKDVCNLSILADKARVERYKNNPPLLNGKEIKLNYVLPEERAVQDLIIIAVKHNGLNDVLDNLKNYVGENTIILSLINGVSSEKEIAKVYGKEHVLHSYFIGHSAVRVGNKVTQDGFGKIVFGSPYEDCQKNVKILEEFFIKNNIDYEKPEDILYSMWLKFALNVYANQMSAIMNLSFRMLKQDSFKKIALDIVNEVKNIAIAEGVKIKENFEKDFLSELDMMINEGKTSMHQDILAGRKTEVDIFAGEIIKLGKKHKIDTPYNMVMYNMIKCIELSQEN